MFRLPRVAQRTPTALAWSSARRSPSLVLRRRLESTVATPPPPPPPAAPPPPTETAPKATTAPDSTKRKTGSFYISNVFPIRLAQWDFRPSWAVLREETLMEQLNDIAMDVTGHGFRIESWEIARKDGGVFLHYSYIPPDPSAVPAHVQPKEDLSSITALPESVQAGPVTPGMLFLPQLLDSAKKHGGIPSWLGQWWAGSGLGSQSSLLPGHRIWARNSDQRLKSVGEAEEENAVEGSGTGLSNVQAAAGGGRIWVVKGRQWTEDMNRPTANRLRIEFDGPDVSQEMLYTLFRPYGRVSDIVPPSPVPAGSLRSAIVSFSRLSPAAIAINCLHGYSTPTNTADYTLRRSGQPSPNPIPLSRLRIYYSHPLKAHAIRDWISSHPRLVLPVVAFLLGTLSYTFFDPIRAFFVRSKLEHTFDLESYPIIKWVRDKFGLFNSGLDFLRGRNEASADKSDDNIGQNAWADRQEAEKAVERWLSEYPSTFITITGPPGSGKVGLVNRVLTKQEKPSLIVDCAEIARAKNDAGLVDALASQTGYWPVFSFLSSVNNLIDLAAVGLIGSKAGFSTPIDQQLRSVLETVGGALKDVSTHAQQRHKDGIAHAKDRAKIKAERDRVRLLMARGGYHDGRLDCVAGNGIMSELGFGDEPVLDSDLEALPPPLLDDVAPIHGEAVPPTKESLKAAIPELHAGPIAKTPEGAAGTSLPADLDAESEMIKSLPIVVLKNFATKSAKGDSWNVIAEWGASLIENRIAHVMVITEGPTATKALVKAMPTKPLNSVGLADADETNSLAYVQDKLGVNGSGGSLTTEDQGQITKLGGRMVDLETLVYKVRTGSPVKEAVEDIVLRNVVELRKAAFGDDAEDAKTLPWNRAQAWKVVQELAKSGKLSYAKTIQEFPFKGAEQCLKAMEEHELITVSYYEGRAANIRPGKPVFRYAFQALIDDPIFRATCQIEYNTALIASAESSIKSAEAELTQLQSITANGGDQALGVPDGGFLGLGRSSAIKERARYLLNKMGAAVEKLGKLETENAEMMKILSQK